MHPDDQQRPPRSAPVWCGLLAVGALACAPAVAQDQAPAPAILRLGGAYPGGVRNSATSSWGTFDLSLTNLSDTDRQARVLLFYPARPEVQYGRDFWVPARSTLSTWMLVGPAAVERPGPSCDIQVLLLERSDGKERLILPPGEERVRSRGVLYREREPTTTLLIDDPPEDAPGANFGRLPQPESWADEAATLVRTFRQTRRFSALISRIPPGSLPPRAEALDGIDHLVIASDGIARDPAGLLALRRWVEGGGRVWVLLDQVEAETVAPLLGDAYDFQVVDRVSLTAVQIEPQPRGHNMAPAPVQQYERPVGLARVLLPAGERVRHTVNGWPAWFSRDVGRGKVFFTALGPRGWVRPRDLRNDPASLYEQFPLLPMPTGPLEVVADELQGRPEAVPVASLRPLLAEEVGYSVAGRGTVALMFAGFLAATAALGLALRRSRRPELVGWLAPAAALAVAGAFLGLGEWSRRAVPPTVAVAQLVEAIPGADEVPVHGLLASYRPESGPAEAGAGQGGLFELDMAGVQGQAHRFIMTDTDSWHWENLSLPAGVRLAPFRYTASTGQPLTALARLGPDGLEGKITAGPFSDLGDALLYTPGRRSMAVRLGPDGTFTAGSQDVLPPGQLLAGAVLSDRQQRRQDLYREMLKAPPPAAPETRSVFLAWAQPIDMHFTLVPGARTVGSALLSIPLRLERPVPGGLVTVPGPLVPYRRILDSGPTRPTLDSDQAADMHLRFQLPAEALPLKVERARLVGKIDAPGRRLTVAGRVGDELVELYRVDSPLDPFRVDIAEGRLLRLDEEGGLHVNVALSGVLGREGAQPGTLGQNEKWKVEYLEIEVTGRAAE